MNQELVNLFRNEELTAKLLEQKTSEDLKRFLLEHGVNLSSKELDEILNSVPLDEDSELSDDQLENVAGGISNIGYDVLKNRRDAINKLFQMLKN